jgi:hypothetical protein
MREASLDDYSQIAGLQSEYGLEVKSYEAWRHLWLNNPVYKEHQDKWPIGWVLEGDNKKIVGYLGNIPLAYEFEGRKLLASVAHAWVVDSRYRGYALLLLERYFSQTVVDLFLNATVGPAASESFAVFQSLPVPVGTWDESAFCITSYSGFLASWLAMKGFPMATPLNYLLSTGPLINRVLSKRAAHPAPCELQVCTQIDDRFDTFWDALKTIKSHLVLGVRTREMLDWHFKYALLANNVWIVIASKGRIITAYGIFCRYDNPTVGLKRMRLVDFQTIQGDITILLAMLSWAQKRCRHEGIHMLEAIGFSEEKLQVFRKIARYGRKLPSWLYFYKARDQDLAGRLKNPKTWDPSQFDGDASL